MTDAPERIWFSPNEGETDKHGWAGVQSGKDRLYWEAEQAHNPEDDEVEYIRADLVARKDAALLAAEELAEAVENEIYLATCPDWEIVAKAEETTAKALAAFRAAMEDTQ